MREATKVAQEASYEALARAASEEQRRDVVQKELEETRGKLTVSLASQERVEVALKTALDEGADATKRAIRAESQLRDVLRREEEAGMTLVKAKDEHRREVIKLEESLNIVNRTCTSSTCGTLPQNTGAFVWTRSNWV